MSTTLEWRHEMSVLDQLKTLSSAEEFFQALGVEYEPQILNVARLHILRRMGQYLVSTDFDGMGEAEIAEAARANLKRAYDDFCESSPIAERVFKVLRENDPNRPVAPKGPALVQLGPVTSNAGRS